ncbi:MAG TPA: protein phosphatase 2C domain-containing protein [Labilithrix sp.]|nr:protein phosphatase 2C domain-containing protein [Labilithrix sp.]
MMQDESVFLAVLGGMGVVVLVLVVAVIVLAKSLQKSKQKAASAPKATSRSSRPAAKRAKAAATAEKSPATRARATAEKAPAARTKTAATAEKALAAHAPVAKGLNVPADADAEVDITRLTAFDASKHLPRLTVEREEDKEESGASSFDESKADLIYDSEADMEEPTGPNDMILLSAVGQTDRGVTRRRNEDAYLIDTNLQLYAVADGMGGYAGGDVASRLAVQELKTALESPTEARGYEDRPRRGRELIAAVERANAAVYREAQTSSDLHGMGTTLLAARFSSQKQRMYLAHVGDSRCYRFRRGELQMLTKDHTLASRGIVGPLAKNICRAVGAAKTVKVDLIVDKPLPDDIFLFCSDGLPKMVPDEHIRRILTNHHGSLDRAAAQLVLAANASGGRDNITVVLVSILEITKTMRRAAALKGQARVEFGP